MFCFLETDDYLIFVENKQVKEILTKIPEETRRELAAKGHILQEGYILEYLPVPPNCLSVPEASDGFSSKSVVRHLKQALRKAVAINNSRSGERNFESHQAEANEMFRAVDNYRDASNGHRVLCRLGGGAPAGDVSKRNPNPIIQHLEGVIPVIHDYENVSFPRNMPAEKCVRLITEALAKIGLISLLKFFVYLTSPSSTIQASHKTFFEARDTGKFESEFVYHMVYNGDDDIPEDLVIPKCQIADTSINESLENLLERVETGEY